MKTGTRTVKQENPNPAITHVQMHICNTEIWQKKHTKTRKTTQVKLTTLTHIDTPNPSREQVKGTEPQNVKKQQHNSGKPQPQREKKAEKRNTVFATKTSETERKTQGKRQTKGTHVPPPKTPTKQTTNPGKSPKGCQHGKTNQRGQRCQHE